MRMEFSLLKPRRFLALLLAAPALFAADFALKPGDRVVFYGDSITDQRLYTTFAETYAVTRFPNLNATFIHSGWGGDRVTGGGGGPVDVRLQRDVLAYRPTVMTIMLGMNDASYKAFDQPIFDTFKNGYEHIIDTVTKADPGIRITVIEPSPFDDVTRPPQFDGGYNGTLLQYSDFIQDLGTRRHLTVADLNNPVVAALQEANDIDATLAAKLIPDRVHPGPAGHLLMAEALLKAWNAPALVTSVEIDIPSGRVVRSQNTRADNFSVAGGTTGDMVSWTQLDRALPMPYDSKDKSVELAIKASDFLEALDNETLKVTGLTAPSYRLKIDDVDAGTFSKEDLANGINLATLETPMMQQALEVHALTLQHANMHNTRWRTIQVPLEKMDLPSKTAAMQALDRLDEELVQKQHAAAQPRSHRYVLGAVD